VFFVADILLPFLLFGTIAGWIYRAVSGTGVNLYQAILHTYTGMTGWAWVVATMLVSSVLSMAIRQIRHLHEKPSDFLRLPVFIIVSTLFLMPIRLLGFLRMAHASGWGTRAGAYSGGGGDDLIAELEQAPAGPSDLVDRAPVGVVPTQYLASPDRTVLTDAGPVRARRAAYAPAEATRVAPAPVAPPKRRRRLNPLAAIPYAIALALFALEALVYV
jgi:hyaluronan synthase